MIANINRKIRAEIKTCRRIQIFAAIVGLNYSLSAFSAEVISNEKSAVTKITPVESLLPMLFGLLSILAIIFLLAILVKKVTGLNIVSNNIKVIESQSLGAKEKLVIVEIQEQQFVLGVTAHAINQICQLQSKIEKKPSALPFDKIMKQFLQPNTNQLKNRNSKTNKQSHSCEVK